MGMIVQVWRVIKIKIQVFGRPLSVFCRWGFDTDQNEWKETEASIYSLFTNSSYASVAPFLGESSSFAVGIVGAGS